MFDQFAQKLLGLRLFFIQNGLGSIQFFPGAFQFFLFRRQVFLGSRHFFGGFAHFLQAALVSCGDFFDHAQPIQKIRKTIGLKQHRPIGDVTVFLHGTDAFFVLFVQFVQLCLSFIQFILLIRNQERICGNLLVDHLNLLMHKSNFLVNHILLIDQIGNLTFVFRHLILNFLHLLLDLFLLGFQFVDLFFDLAGRSSAGLGGNQT